MIRVWRLVAEAYQDNIMAGGSGGALLAQQRAAAAQAARQSAIDNNNSSIPYTDANGVVVGGYDQPAPGVRTNSSANTSSGDAPSKASAAPVAGKQDIFTGLCDALNAHQLELVKLKQREIPDQYVIEFAPSALGDATIKRPGDQNQNQAPMQNNTTASDQLSQEKQSLNKNAMTWPVAAGTQIVQLIDNVMRVSSYITDQQIVQVSPVGDPKTGVQKQVPSPGTGQPPAWFKISVAAEPLGKDNVINDFAYRMTFIVSPYQPAQLISQYFPDSKYRGVHKSYQYWFTGQNTQILSYEQKYDNAYRITMSGIGVETQKKLKTDWRDQNRKIYVATSENHAQGAKDYANEPGDNAASFLYDPKSLSTVKMRIVGDPAWLQQGECGLGVSARTFTFAPFTPDGSINFDASAIMFDVSFNQPVDYDFNTGIMNTNTMNRQGLPQEHYTFTAVECKSTFSKGRFEQELTGKLVTDEVKAPTTAGTGRPVSTTAPTAPTAPTASPAAGSRQPATGFGDEEETYTTDSKGNTFKDGTLYRAAEVDEFPEDQLPASPQPAAPPAAPTSNGDIDYNAGLAGTSSAPQNASAPDKVLANEEETAAVNAYIAAGGTFPRGTGPITSGPLFDNVVSAKASLTARQQAAASSATTSSAPQIIAKDDS
jgi:hypothetical protein